MGTPVRMAMVMAAGAIMLVSSVAHGLLGWSAVSAELRKSGLDDHVIGAMAAGWHFGSAAMAAFGIIVIHTGMRLRQATAPASPT